jgi:sugar transferase (PEP-CTERM/EpsH1 system associated)
MTATPPTVAQIVTGLQIGGLERVTVNLVRGLQAQPFRHLVICLEEGGPFVSEVEKLGVKAVILGKRPGISWPTVWRLNKLFRRENVKIIHTHNPAPHTHGVLAALLAGVPVRVHTKHGRNYPTMKKRVLLNHVLSWFTDAIVPVSDNAGAVALEIEKVNPKKVRRIWNGVDTELYKPNVQRSTLNVQRPTIGTVARLSPEKDQQTMLAAFKLVLEQWPGSRERPASGGSQSKEDRSLALAATPRLVFIGDGPCRADLEAAADRLGIAGQVDFLGARHDVPALLPDLTVFTLSSITEGISMTLLEAMACGVPIVATDVGGNREIVQPPTCGLIVPARDPQALATAYLELLRDPERCAKMGAAGRQRVLQHFSLDKMCADYRKLYEELCQVKGGLTDCGHIATLHP